MSAEKEAREAIEVKRASALKALEDNIRARCTEPYDAVSRLNDLILYRYLNNALGIRIHSIEHDIEKALKKVVPS